MPSPEPTILTKWGRLTGAQWQEARQREAMDNWWTPEVEAYVAENWPNPDSLPSTSGTGPRRSAPIVPATPPPRTSPAWPVLIVPAQAQTPDPDQPRQPS
jgi:hypothetical protein